MSLWCWKTTSNTPSGDIELGNRKDKDSKPEENGLENGFSGGMQPFNDPTEATENEPTEATQPDRFKVHVSGQLVSVVSFSL